MADVKPLCIKDGRIQQYGAGDTISSTIAPGSGGGGGGGGRNVYAWAYITYVSSTLTIVASHNIASATRTATGRFTFSFTTPLPSLNVGYVAGGRFGNNNDAWSAFPGLDRRTGNGLRLNGVDWNVTTNGSANLFDPEFMFFEIYELGSEGGGGTPYVWEATGSGAGNTGAFGARGGMATLQNPAKVRALTFCFTALATVSYQAMIVELDASNTVTSVVASKTLSAGLPTDAYSYHIFEFSSDVSLQAGKKYGFVCVRNTESGSSAWAMQGTSSGAVIMNAGFMQVNQYIRATVNTVGVGTAFSVGSNPYWLGLKVTPT